MEMRLRRMMMMRKMRVATRGEEHCGKQQHVRKNDEKVNPFREMNRGEQGASTSEQKLMRGMLTSAVATMLVLPLPCAILFCAGPSAANELRRTSRPRTIDVSISTSPSSRPAPTIPPIHYRVKSALASPTLSVKLMPYAALTLVLTVAGASVYRICARTSWQKALQTSFYLLSNAPGVDATNEEGRASAFAATVMYVVGSLSFAVLLGIVSETFVSGVEAVRTSNDVVLESGHSVVLNWNEEGVLALLESLAAEKEKRPSTTRKKAVVILGADRQRNAMEEALQNYVSSKTRSMFSRIMVRTGSAHRLADLERVNVRSAADIFILQPEGEQPTNHASTLLGIRRACVGTSHHAVIAQVSENCDRDVDGNSIVSLAAGENENATLARVSASEVLQNLIGQSVVEPLLAPCWAALFDPGVDGVRLACRTRIDLRFIGRTFGDVRKVVGASTGDIVLGYLRNGVEQRTNPDEDEILEDGDRLIVLSGSNSFESSTSYDRTASRDEQPRHIVIVGLGDAVDMQLIGSVIRAAPSGSSISVLSRTSAWKSAASSASSTSKMKNGGGDDQIAWDFVTECGIQIRHVPGDLDAASLRRAGVETCDAVLLAPSFVSKTETSSNGNDNTAAAAVRVNDDDDDDSRLVTGLVLLEGVMRDSGRKLPHIVGQTHDADLATTVREVYGAELFRPSKTVAGLMATIAADAQAGKLLCEIVHARYGEELDVQDITAHVDSGEIGREKEFGALVDELRASKKITVVGYVSGDGKGAINIPPSTNVPCNATDMLIIIGNVRF